MSRSRCKNNDVVYHNTTNVPYDMVGAKKNVHVGTKKKSEKIGTNRKNDFLKLELESKKGQS